MKKELKGVEGKEENSREKKGLLEVLSGLAERLGLSLELSRAELMGGSRRRRVYGISLTKIARS